MADILNTARVNGLYDEETPLVMETELTVIAAEMTIQKTANREVWTEGPLAYSITVVNSETVPVTGLTLTDTLDAAVVYMPDTATLQINGQAPTALEVTVNPDNVLTAELGTLNAESTAIISFQVNKV